MRAAEARHVATECQGVIRQALALASQRMGRACPPGFRDRGKRNRLLVERALAAFHAWQASLTEKQ